jgi:hypothetical protein
VWIESKDVFLSLSIFSEKPMEQLNDHLRLESYWKKAIFLFSSNVSITFSNVSITSNYDNKKILSTFFILIVYLPKKLLTLRSLINVYFSWEGREEVQSFSCLI